MRTVDGTTLAALQARNVKERTLLWLTAKDFSTGAAHAVGFWTDLGSVSMTVVSGQDGADATRTYVGAGTLLAVDDIPLTNNLGVRTINASLSQLDAATTDAIRGYDLKLAPVEIHRAVFTLGSWTLVAKPLPRFVGYVDQCLITTPSEGKRDGGVSLSIVSHTRELTRSNTDTRSDQSQQARHAGDRFYMYTSVVGTWQINWGKNKPEMTQQQQEAWRQSLNPFL